MYGPLHLFHHFMWPQRNRFYAGARRGYNGVPNIHTHTWLSRSAGAQQLGVCSNGSTHL